MVVVETGTVAEPVVGRVTPSSGLKTGGVMFIEVALVVAQLMVVFCPPPISGGFAVKDVICGCTACATFTVTLCGDVAAPDAPVATAV